MKVAKGKEKVGPRSLKEVLYIVDVRTISHASARLASWDAEADLAAVQSWVPTIGAEKPKLDHDAVDEAIVCIQRLLRNEAANVDALEENLSLVLCSDDVVVAPSFSARSCHAGQQ